MEYGRVENVPASGYLDYHFATVFDNVDCEVGACCLSGYEFYLCGRGNYYGSIFNCLLFRCGHKDIAAARLENVTQTISRILEGYDIRLRPNFGGKNINIIIFY